MIAGMRFQGTEILALARRNRGFLGGFKADLFRSPIARGHSIFPAASWQERYELFSATAS
jgi:hypothetical protein